MSSKSCFKVRLTTIALCLAAASLTAACGGGGGEAGASEVDAARRDGSTGKTTTTAAVPSGVAFACTFETTFYDCGFGEHAKVPGRATMVNVAGANAVRLHTEPGDNNVNGVGERMTGLNFKISYGNQFSPNTHVVPNADRRCMRARGST